MTFKILTIILGGLVVVLLLALRTFQGEVKIFVKKTNYYLFGTLLLFAVVGLTGLSLRQPDPVSATTIAWIYYILCLGAGVLHAWLMFEVLPWANRNTTHNEWLFTAASMAVGSLAFFQSSVFFEKNRNLDTSYADNFLWGIFLFPVPLLCQKIYELWMAIPRLKVTGWELPLDARPPDPQPGKSLKISLLIPLRDASDETIQIDLLAPAERTLGDTFHYVLYRHNVEKNSYKKIEIAEGNSRQRVYHWLFYKKAKKWWWTSRQYLNPHQRVRDLFSQNGEIIFVERLKHW